MEIVVDTSALMAVIVAEPQRDRIIAATKGHTLIGPGSIIREVGNAFSSMLKQGRIRVETAQRAFERFSEIAIQYVEIDFQEALAVCGNANLYAYDAYLIDCARRHGAPLLTLDRGLGRAAEELGIHLLEF